MAPGIGGGQARQRHPGIVLGNPEQPAGGDDLPAGESLAILCLQQAHDDLPGIRRPFSIHYRFQQMMLTQ